MKCSIHIQKGIIWYITDTEILIFSKMYLKVFRETILKLLNGIYISSYYSVFSWRLSRSSSSSKSAGCESHG